MGIGAATMSDEKRSSGPMALPEYLELCIEKGILDERAAKRIELYRRTRGLGRYESPYILLTDPPDAGLTFENLVQSKGNSFAIELAKTVADKPPSDLPYNPLYFYGDVGLGKTHLLSAIANASPDKNVLFVNTGDLDIEIEHADSRKSRTDLRRWLSSAEILLLDDIQLCEERDDLQREIFSVLNHLIRAHRWAVISSDLPPTRLEGIEKRLLSRLQGGVIVSLQMGDKQERMAAIRHFLGDQPVAPEVMTYLAESVTDSMRGLKAAVAQVLTMSRSTGQEVNMEMARSVAPSPEPPADADSVTIVGRTSDGSPDIPERHESGSAQVIEASAREYGEEEQPPNRNIDPDVQAMVEKLAGLEHTIAVAAVQDGEVSYVKRMRYSELDLPCIARHVAAACDRVVAEAGVGSGRHLRMAFPDGSHVVSVNRGKTTYCVFLTYETKTALSIPEIRAVLEG
jgi:hypothetical protein